MGTGVLPNFLRKPYGPGWALVGDAGHHKDPVGGLGIMDAFRDADLLADALDAGLSGRRPLDEALGGYEQRRNAATAHEYERNYQLARLQPPRTRGDGCSRPCATSRTKRTVSSAPSRARSRAKSSTRRRTSSGS